MLFDTLVEDAIAAAHRAYAPYSHFRVGAALATPDGSIFTGCNVENASYPAGICAERNALFHAVSTGSQTFETIVIATINGGSPCGICRQALFEFAPTLRVVCVNFQGEITLDQPLDALLPAGFGPVNLPRQA